MRHRRIRAAVLGFLACALVSAGCSPAGQGNEQASPPGEAVTTDPQGRQIVLVLDNDPALREDYPTVAGLARSESVVAIVRGTVSATRDLYVDRVGFRVLTVDVAETLRGETGGQITVLEDGAVVPYADVAAQLAEKQGAPARTDTDGYIDFRFMGARHSEVGDEVVLFLGVNPNVGTPIDTQYFIVSSVHGRFTLDTTTNTFQRGGAEGLPAGFTKSAQLATLRSAASTR